MALGNYSQLKTAIENWSHRSDVTELLDDFIDMCETEMYTGDTAQIRMRDMITTETSAMSASVQYQALPTRFLETKRIDATISSERYTIDYVTNEQMNIRSGTGVPSVYTITSRIEYDIQPDSAYVTNHIHYAKLTALDATNTTNAILTNYPNIYLFGCLWALNVWQEDTEEEAKYKQKFLTAIIGANSADNRGSRGVSMQKRLRARTP